MTQYEVQGFTFRLLVKISRWRTKNQTSYPVTTPVPEHSATHQQQIDSNIAGEMSITLCEWSVWKIGRMLVLLQRIKVQCIWSTRTKHVITEPMTLLQRVGLFGLRLISHIQVWYSSTPQFCGKHFQAHTIIRISSKLVIVSYSLWHQGFCSQTKNGMWHASPFVASFDGTMSLACALLAKAAYNFPYTRCAIVGASVEPSKLSTSISALKTHQDIQREMRIQPPKPHQFVLLNQIKRLVLIWLVIHSQWVKYLLIPRER